MLKALGDRVVVEPYFDSDKIGSIYIPEYFKNPEPQQGVVVSAGPLSPFVDGTYVFFHPFRSQPLGDTKLIGLHDKDIVATLVDEELVPLEDHVMVLPDWESKTKHKGIIFLPPTVTIDNSPVIRGTVVRSNSKLLEAGTMVVIPPGKGSEIGYIDTVYYLIHQDEILATIDADDSGSSAQ
jgi:co-chaperonin GroES (HSP10)